jgi:hypothetical protein
MKNNENARTEQLLDLAINAGYIVQDEVSKDYIIVNTDAFSDKLLELLGLAAKTIYGSNEVFTRQQVFEKLKAAGITNAMSMFVALYSDQYNEFRTVTKVINRVIEEGQSGSR